jgi:hypothetical protein
MTSVSFFPGLKKNCNLSGDHPLEAAKKMPVIIPRKI